MADRERAIVALSVVLGSLALNGCGHPTTIHPSLPRELQQPDQIIDWHFTRLIKKGFPGAAVIVSQNGQIIYQREFGYSDVEHCIPITPETKFRIGSITKQFTAAAILKLQESGKLSLDDKLSEFIPDYPRGDEVTIHHLLTHTSGIPSYTSRPDFMKTVTVPIDPRRCIDSFKNDTFDFDPGEHQMYSNSGYFLLGYIVEIVSGKPLQDYLKETFFDPLGMRDTGIYHRNLKLDHEAAGYSYINGKVRKAIDWDMSRAGGAGALYSTVIDLNKWNEAIFNGNMLKESTLKAALTPVVLNDGSTVDYGYGFHIDEFCDMKLIHHRGDLHGFASYLMRIPQENFTVAVLANSSPGVPGMQPSALANFVAKVYLFGLTDRVSLKEDKTIDSGIYDDYVGRYDYGPDGVLIVTKQRDRLFVQLTGQSKYEIFPVSKEKFFWEIVDAQIVFVRDEKGNVTHALHYQGGCITKAPRLEESEPYLLPDRL